MICFCHLKWNRNNEKRISESKLSGSKTNGSCNYAFNRTISFFSWSRRCIFRMRATLTVVHHTMTFFSNETHQMDPKFQLYYILANEFVLMFSSIVYRLDCIAKKGFLLLNSPPKVSFCVFVCSNICPMSH